MATQYLELDSGVFIGSTTRTLSVRVRDDETRRLLAAFTLNADQVMTLISGGSVRVTSTRPRPK